MPKTTRQPEPTDNRRRHQGPWREGPGRETGGCGEATIVTDACPGNRASLSSWAAWATLSAPVRSVRFTSSATSRLVAASGHGAVQRQRRVSFIKSVRISSIVSASSCQSAARLPRSATENWTARLAIRASSSAQARVN